jgi:hypothetical protein
MLLEARIVDDVPIIAEIVVLIMTPLLMLSDLHTHKVLWQVTQSSETGCKLKSLLNALAASSLKKRIESRMKAAAV